MNQTETDLTGLQEFIPACASWFPLDRFKALAYFEQSSFFAAAGRDAAGQPVVVNNTEARLAGLDPALPGVLESLPHGRPEFVLETAQEPHTFVIRKQIRPSANPMERPIVLAYYYIANNKIMQAPSAHQVTHARLQRCTFALQQGFQRLQADLEPLTREARLLAKQGAKEAAQQPGQQQAQQPSGGGGGGTAAPADQAAATAAAAAASRAALALAPAAAAHANGAPGGVRSGSPNADGGHPHKRPRVEPGPGPGARAAPPALSYTVQPYGAAVDLESPSLGTLRAPLAAPLPEVMAAAAAAAAAEPRGGGGGSGGAGSAPVRRHLTDADRARWSKLDRILSHQFSSLQRIKYTALPPEYLQQLHQQMYGPRPPSPPPPPPPAGGGAAAVAGTPGRAAAAAAVAAPKPGVAAAQ